MGPRLAIFAGEDTWAERWAASCASRGVEHERVDLYASDVISVLRSFDGLLWHFYHDVPADMLMARHVLYSAARMGLEVFPDFDTCWYFDDKLAEKYVLEAVGAPLVPSWAFYDRAKALHWLETEAQFPLVAKLRGGAGARGVRLLKTRRKARTYCDRMFARGYAPMGGFLKILPNRIKHRKSLGDLFRNARKLPRFARSVWQTRHMPRERGYVLFQKFIPNNAGDIRMKVVGDRIWGLLRKNRRGDWRASGSGEVVFDRNAIPVEAVRVARDVARGLHTQCIAYDMLLDEERRPVIAEISYAFGYTNGQQQSAGYWDRDLVWHDQRFDLWDDVVADLLERIAARKRAQAGRNAVS